MKRLLYLSIALTCITSSNLSAQGIPPLPQPGIVPHYHVQAAFNSTTVLIFPAIVKSPADRGTRDVLAQKQTGVDNVLKLKAARRNFAVTNLHVFTSDGKIYAFDVSYTDSLAQTYDFTNLSVPVTSLPPSPVAIIPDEPLNADQMKQFVTTLNAAHGRHQGPSNHAAGMSIRLEKVALGGPLLFFRYRLANHSNLEYPLDFLHIHIVAVPTFTLADGKELIVEVYEKNGGRYLLLRVRNKPLLRAKNL